MPIRTSCFLLELPPLLTATIKTAGNVGVTFRVGPKTEKTAAIDSGTSDEVLQRLDALSRKVDRLEAENQDLKNKLNIK